MKRSLLLLFCLGGALTLSSFAATLPNPTSDYYPTNFADFPGTLGGGTGVSTDGLWSFSWTAPAFKTFSQHSDCNQYGDCYWWFNATYKPGGSFTLSGPGGVVFTGAFTIHGSAWGDDSDSDFRGEVADGVFSMQLTGTWNNGLAEGITLYQEQTGDHYSVGDASLTFGPATTPEPASLMLLASGITVLAGRLWRK